MIISRKLVTVLAGMMLVLLFIGAACNQKGKTGAPGAAGAPAPVPVTPTALLKGQNLPGVVITVTSVTGASGAGGAFQAGDRPAVRFAVKKNDGSALNLSELNSTGILLSGPTFNYQRVIASQSDLITASVENSDGSYTYTFATGIPANYPAPLNDTAAFGTGDGELQGQALLSGTYTIGIQAYKNYTIEGVTYRDAADSVTHDILFGTATAIDARDAVGTGNCNQCHDRVQAHGGGRVDNVRYCLLCHTAGAEDRNVGTVLGGTPGISINFKTMIHKIHNGHHLPSVLGVGVTPAGARDYTATPKPYQIVGYNNSIHDFSAVGFPVMPSAYVSYLYAADGTTYTGTGGNGPMPKDTGYASLALSEKLQNDQIRTGVVACAKCHDDPDGTGPITAPAQGSLAFSQPSRQVCGSCHDDIDWTKPYVKNGLTMPAQANDSNCATCHTPSGTNLSVQDAHLHPYNNPLVNTGVNINVTAIGAGSGAGGNYAAGDRVEVTFNLENDGGSPLTLHDMSRYQIIVAGPTSNSQLVLPAVSPFDRMWRKSSPFTGSGTVSKPMVGGSAVQQVMSLVFTADNTFDVIGSVSGTLATGIVVPDSGGNTGALTHNDTTYTVTDGSTNFVAGDRFYFEVVPTNTSYTMYIPADVVTERIGAATGAADVLNVANTPLYVGRQVVYERTALLGSTTIAGSVPENGRFVVADAAVLSGAGVAVNDTVVIDTGASEEYIVIGRIQTTHDETGADLGSQDRVWFKTPLRYAHSSGVTIQEVTLSSKREGIAYDITDAATGQITLVAGQFTAGNPVVVNYRTDGRFGWYRAPGDSLQAVYPAPTFDSDEFGITSGEWKSLPFVDGTYTVGMWANADFTVTPAGTATTTEAWNNIGSDNTTYRMISPAATRQFLFGTATTITPRAIVSSPSNCDTCHTDLMGHGNGRRGLDTCLLCHANPGTEDAAKYAYNSWYVGPTPNTAMEFRTLLHTVHMGKGLYNASSYTANGVFLGVPYPLKVDEIVFPSMPGEVSNCAKCHGATNTAWKAPADRNHPTGQTAPVTKWKAVCNSCHDSPSAGAHLALQTSAGGVESCDVCHGPGKAYSVEMMHKVP